MTSTITRWVLFSGLYSMLALLSFHSRDAWSLSTTLWFPASLLFAVLWLTPVRDWPLWLVTAGLLHVFAGVWIGRPLSLACLFALFDVVIFPLAVIVFRYSMPLLWRHLARKPIACELAWLTLLVLSTFSGSALLSNCLLLVGYPVEPLHMLSWALAALPGLLAILPFLREHGESPFSLWQSLGNVRTLAVVAANVVLPFLLFYTPVGLLLPGLIPLFVQLTLLMLSVFTLSGRGLGIVLMAQYLIVVLATQHREGIFFTLTPAVIPAIWQAQWFLMCSAILTACLHQYQVWVRHKQSLAEGTDTLLARFALTGSGLFFSLEMPMQTLHWQSNTEVFFPGESHSICTLELLEAHCDTSFMSAFLHWYDQSETSIFEQALTLQRLNGQQARCLLTILRISGESHLTGGISQYSTHLPNP